jgi:hypothetical protein
VEPTTKWAKAGTIVQYNFTLKNTGNKDDSVYIKTGILGGLSGWSASVNIMSPYAIAANASTTFTLDVFAPVDALYPTSAYIFLNVSSQGNSSVFVNTTVIARILASYGVDFHTNVSYCRISQRGILQPHSQKQGQWTR